MPRRESPVPARSRVRPAPAKPAAQRALDLPPPPPTSSAVTNSRARPRASRALPSIESSSPAQPLRERDRPRFGELRSGSRLWRRTRTPTLWWHYVHDGQPAGHHLLRDARVVGERQHEPDRRGVVEARQRAARRRSPANSKSKPAGGALVSPNSTIRTSGPAGPTRASARIASSVPRRGSRRARIVHDGRRLSRAFLLRPVDVVIHSQLEVVRRARRSVAQHLGQPRAGRHAGVAHAE